MTSAEEFEEQRPRLLALATRILADPAEAQDVVQQAWLRLHGAREGVDSLAAWLTTVTTRLCLDRLKARIPEPAEPHDMPDAGAQAGQHADPELAATRAAEVGEALGVVVDRLTPAERVAFVLHDGFAVDFPAVARILDTTPAAARKLASRGRAKLGEPEPYDTPADWAVVDAFLAAAQGGDLARLVQLLAPDAEIGGDAVAVAMGSPARVAGRGEVAAFFNGAARAAFPVLVAGRPGAAWIHRGETRVAFDFTVVDGVVRDIRFRADPAVLAQVVRRDGPVPRP